MASFSDTLLSDNYSSHYDNSSQLFHYDRMLPNHLPNHLQQADVGRYSSATLPFTDSSFSQHLLLPVVYSQILY